MTKTVFLVALLMIFATMGVANAAASAPAPDNPFSVLEAAINDLAAQVAQLFTKTEDLQQQVNNIGAQNTSVVVNNNVPVPGVTVNNEVPFPNVTVTNEVSAPEVTINNEVPFPNVTVNNEVPVPEVTVTNNMPEPNVTVNVNSNTPEVTVNNNVPVPNVTVNNNIAVSGSNPATVDSFFDIFVYVKGTKSGVMNGESTTIPYENWINARSYKYNINQPIDAASGLPTGKLRVGSFIITKELDSASPLLAMALVDSENLNNVTVVLVKKSTGEKYMEYRLQNVIISSIDTAGDGSDERPIEEVSFNYQKINLIYSQKKDGSPVNVQAQWDRSAPVA